MHILLRFAVCALAALLAWALCVVPWLAGNEAAGLAARWLDELVRCDELSARQGSLLRRLDAKQAATEGLLTDRRSFAEAVECFRQFHDEGEEGRDGATAPGDEALCDNVLDWARGQARRWRIDEAEVMGRLARQRREYLASRPPAAR
jgi:hypothetical protein